MSVMLRTALKYAALVVGVYVLINLTTLSFVVDGSSMEPAFETGQLLLVSRIHYLLGQPNRSDSVVFYLSTDPRRDYIKRVIGLPGETVELRDSLVYIDGEQLDEPYVAEACLPALCRNSIWQLGPDEYFLMGDNRNHSSDSRAFGPVPRSSIVGEVLVRYWPVAGIGWINQMGLSQ